MTPLTRMSTPLEFFIGISDGYSGIGVIYVKLAKKLTLDTFEALVYCLDTNSEQFISDINAGKKGTSAFNRVAMKQHELEALLPEEQVLLCEDFRSNGVYVEYDDEGIPIPIENATLAVFFINNTNDNTRIVYPDQFKTKLYDYLVCHF